MTAEYRPPQGDFTLVTITQLAGEIGRSVPQTRKLLAKLNFVGIHPRRNLRGQPIAYEVEDLEALKALLGHTDTPTTTSQDWLTDYLKGPTTHG